MLDHVLLGQGFDGRIQSVMPSQQVQMAVVAPDGELVVGDAVGDSDIGKFRTTPQSDANIGFATFFQHTASATSRPCATCHRTDDTPEEWERVRGVYGHGTGEVILPNPRGEPVDVLQFLDDDGNSMVEWTHRGTGPASAEVRERALGVVVDP